jgi:hypothetical protein
MLDGWTIFYGILTMLTVGIAFRAPDAIKGVRPAAYLLACSYVLSNLFVLYARPFHGQFYPLMDSVFGIVFLTMWLKDDDNEWWTFGIAALFMLMGARHMAFFHGGDNSYAARYAYDLSLNLAYMVQLAIVATVSMVRTRRLRTA